MSDNELMPVQVEIKNWADGVAKPRLVKRTTVQTILIDPTTANGKVQQIATYEPERIRLVIQVIDTAVMLVVGGIPNTSPDPATATVVGVGRYLPPTVNYDYTFYGPDAMWLNSIVANAVTRVTVTKEYA